MQYQRPISREGQVPAPEGDSGGDIKEAVRLCCGTELWILVAWIPIWSVPCHLRRLLKPSNPGPTPESEREGWHAISARSMYRDTVLTVTVQGCCVTVTGVWEPHKAPRPGGLRSAQGPHSDAPPRKAVFPWSLRNFLPFSKLRQGPSVLSQQQAGDAYSYAGGGKAKKDVMLPLEFFKALQVSQLCSQDAVLGPRLANCAWWGCF